MQTPKVKTTKGLLFYGLLCACLGVWGYVLYQVAVNLAPREDLLIAAPVLWWFRQKTLFILVHNVQMAAHRRRDRIAVVPSWDELAEKRPGDIVIHLDPGQAFGTGLHATTRLCLGELDRLEATGATADQIRSWISTMISGFSPRNVLAFSLPWPSCSPS